MSYRVTWTDAAEHGLEGAPPADRAGIRSTVERGLSTDPYGCGSTPVNPRDPDRRDASFGRVVVRYEISGGVTTVTVLRCAGW
ncbi:hypothetical protein [Embleya sp. AB8]|uniref:hypothetical protein n=1 Tax=Embleya sp. AB8 TaxID=3156304 RepID=UPI003C71E551